MRLYAPADHPYPPFYAFGVTLIGTIVHAQIISVTTTEDTPHFKIEGGIYTGMLVHRGTETPLELHLPEFEEGLYRDVEFLAKPHQGP